MNSYPAYHYGQVEQPTQAQVLQATCGFSTDIGSFTEVHKWHYGADGIGYTAEQTRTMFIADQALLQLHALQPWALYELLETAE